MKFIEIEEFGGPDVLRLKEGGAPSFDENQVLIDVKFAGVNYMDLMFRAGAFGGNLPFRPGLELSGTISAIGDKVRNFKVGDPVVARTRSGAYATQIALPAHGEVIPLPKQAALDVAAAVLIQGVTAYFLIQEAQVKPTDVVVVSAAGGGVGGLAIQMAKNKGAKVIGLASPRQHEQVLANGADHVMDYAPGWAKRVLDLTSGKGANVFIDSIGEMNGEGLTALAEFGRWILFGVRAEAENNQLSVQQLWGLITKNIVLRGCNAEGFFSQAERALREILGWIDAGQLKVAMTKYPLAEASSVHALFEQRKATGKIVLVC